MSNILEIEKEESAQARFDKQYITSAEIMQRLKLTRSSILYARRKGKLPNAIEVQPGNLYIWERKDVEPYIEAWRIVLNARRGA